MVTQNYYNMLQGLIMDLGVTVKDIQGATLNVPAPNEIEPALLSTLLKNTYCMTSTFRTEKVRTSSDPTNSDGCSCVVFGTGDTEETEEDYALSGSLLSDISNVTVANSTYNENIFTEKTITFVNKASAPVTVKEVGLYGSVYVNGAYHYVLLDRTVLGEPVTVPAGGIGLIEYRLAFAE